MAAEKIPDGFQDGGCGSGGGVVQDVDIFGRPGPGVEGDRVAADNQALNAVCV